MCLSLPTFFPIKEIKKGLEGIKTEKCGSAIVVLNLLVTSFFFSTQFLSITWQQHHGPLRSMPQCSATPLSTMFTNSPSDHFPLSPHTQQTIRSILNHPAHCLLIFILHGILVHFCSLSSTWVAVIYPNLPRTYNLVPAWPNLNNQVSHSPLQVYSNLPRTYNLAPARPNLNDQIFCFPLTPSSI